MRTARSGETTGFGRLSRLMAAVVMLVAAAAVTVMLDAAPAAARCLGSGHPKAIPVYSGGRLVAQETVQYASTCDGDSQFRDKVKDAVTDGHCAYVVMFDPGQSVIGRECTTGAWSNFTGWDQQGNHDAHMLVCLYSDCRDVAPGFAFRTWGF